MNELLATSSPLAAVPIHLEYMPGWMAAALFAVLAAPILLLGMRSLNGLGPTRKWVAIALRLAVLALFILMLGGIRWQRQHKDLEVIVLRDLSESTTLVRQYPGETLQMSLNEYLRNVAAQESKPPDDRIGLISFDKRPMIDALPNTSLLLDARAIREPGSGTDVASAIQLGLASFSNDAMRRMLLIWDGNQTAGDLEAAISAAAAQQVPIDVLPLRYDVTNEVIVERFVAPNWRRENEPFTLDVILRSTNERPVRGRLSVWHQDELMDLDPDSPQSSRVITLEPGLNVQRVRVPPLASSGVHQFRAVFEAEEGADTILANNIADAFTFVQGQGQVLYIDNSGQGDGALLARALAAEGIALDEDRRSVDQFPNRLMDLQSYEAVILANVPRGAGGLSEEQQQMLAAYVHDMGGGLVMIGGEEAFGAGGWQGSKLEEILPVNMDIPAQRQIAKGALVLVMHACEMPNGNYWGQLCALKAVETLSARDEVGVVSYDWGRGGSQWDWPLQEKGDGSRVSAAIKEMRHGDMPSFEDSLELALNGRDGQGGLIRSDARQKHVIVISDGDPQRPSQRLVDQYRQAQVSISTITVYPHMGDPDGLPPVMKDMPLATGGRHYGPINQNPNQLPQIFIKEATVVRRSLIHEDKEGIPLQIAPTSSELVRGMSDFPPVYGMVLTSRKPNPQIEVPIVAGMNADPVLAHWQTGLGRAAVFTSDAHNRWAAHWAASPAFGKFWAQVVRGVARPPMSSDFDIQTIQSGEKATVTVEALDKQSGFLNFLNIRGTVLTPDMESHEVRLVQSGPGTYTAEFDTPRPGNYVVVLNYRDQQGEGGVLLSGVAMNHSPELRELRSNERMLEEIAGRTGGRVLRPWDVEGAEVFSRDGVKVSASPLPVWDLMIPVLLALILADVATRRIAWDWAAIRAAAARRVREFTMARKVETRESIDALQRIRQESRDSEEQPQEAAAVRSQPAEPRPDPSAKFEAAGVDGDITKIVGGATDKPVPPPPKKVEPKGAAVGAGTGGHTGSLLEAKRRARQAIQQREKDGG